MNKNLANSTTPTLNNLDFDDILTNAPHQEMHLTDDEIAKVIQPKKLADLLAQADAFNFINSENLDEF